MSILFQPWTKASPLTLDHELRCSIGGHVHALDLKHKEVDWDDETDEDEKQMVRQVMIGLRKIAEENR